MCPYYGFITLIGIFLNIPLLAFKPYIKITRKRRICGNAPILKFELYNQVSQEFFSVALIASLVQASRDPFLFPLTFSIYDIHNSIIFAVLYL